MSSFQDINELKRSFVTGNFDFPETIDIDDVEYRFLRSVNHKLEDMINKGFKAMFIYTARPSEENLQKLAQTELSRWVVLLWGFDNKNRMIPYTVKSITQSREHTVTRQNMDNMSEDYKEVHDDRIIPDQVKILILDLAVARELVGKVDTGADVCSLHAENIDVNRNTNKVSFDCPPLSDNRITMPLHDQQAIRVPSSEETVYRPVILLNLKIAEKALKEIKVNLNDRGNMDQPFLIGQNALEAGNFLIDPNIIKEEDDVDEEYLVEQLIEKFRYDVVEEDSSLTTEEVSKLYDIFENSDITFGELIKQLRTETINRIEDLDY